ncbi:MAG: transcription termination factor Rho [Myxococcota bacterium]|jgi:transcription termination factor Rho
MSSDLVQLQETEPALLVEQARNLGVRDADTLHRRDLVYAIATAEAEAENTTLGRGVLEVHGEGFGFLRSPDTNYLPGSDDIYVSQSQIRRFKLQTGDTVIGQVRPPKEGERYLALLRVLLVNNDRPGVDAPSFETLTAIYPDDRIQLGAYPLLSAVDRVAPLGLGQRGVLAAPARTGRVGILRELCDALTADEDLDVTVLLIDERPEEIQEWRKNSNAEIIATPFDEPPARHVQVADIVFERARRMVERGDDVVLIVDSLSRLLRGCLSDSSTGERHGGGVDPAALHRVRRYMGAARALEEGGSLTVIGVVSGDSHNPIDTALLDDLRDVVNWECTLSTTLANRGLRPPIDVHRSGTRRVERLLTDAEHTAYLQWRKSLTGDDLEDGHALLAWSAPALDSAVGSGN